MRVSLGAIRAPLALLVCVVVTTALAAAQAQAASPSGAFYPNVASITDGNGKVYTVATTNGMKGVIEQNGVADTRTAHVTLLLYFNDLIYQQISEGAWWSTNGANWPKSVWNVTSDPRVTSASGTTVPKAIQLVDANKKVYAIAGGVIDQNGVPDTRTAQVTLLLYYKGLVYQQIRSGAWWSTNGTNWPKSVWTPTKDPRVTAQPSPSPSVQPNPVPSMAAEVGFNTLTFNSTNVVDDNTAPAGGWFLFNFHFLPMIAAEAVDTAEGLFLSGHSSNDYAATIATAAYNPNEPMGFKGMAFGGGWYYEGTFSYAGVQTADLICMWAASVETAQSQEPGEQWVEMDGPEFDVNNSTTQYGRSLHNWIQDGSVRKRIDPAATSKAITIPSGSKPLGDNNIHTYGNLWVPATATTQGYMKWYFDGVQVGETLYWDKYSGTTLFDGTFPPTGAQIGAVIDIQHFMPIFGDSNPNTPMTINSVRIWQASGANNIIH